MNRTVFRPALVVLLGGALAQGAPAQVVDFGHGRWIDLSHDYAENTIYWPTARTFSKRTVFEGTTPGGYYYTAYDIETAEHGGTHLDAPVHFAEGGQAADEVPLERLAGPGLVIDISAQCAQDADYLLSVADLEDWQARHGGIRAGDIVLVRTGFAAFWPDARRYLGTAERGEAAIAALHFPGISAAVAEWLVARGIAAVGIDTASVDRGQSSDYQAHRVLYAANIPGFENVADLSGLPPRGAFIVALPMKIRGGSGAPLRIVAFVPDSG